MLQVLIHLQYIFVWKPIKLSTVISMETPVGLQGLYLIHIYKTTAPINSPYLAMENLCS